MGSKPFSALCLWRAEYQLFVDSNPVSACVYDGKNNDYLWIPNKFPHNDFLQEQHHSGTQYMREVNFLQTEISGKYQRLFLDSKPFPAHCLWQEEQRLFADSKLSAHCLWREEQRLFVDSKPFSACVYGGKNNNYL